MRTRHRNTVDDAAVSAVETAAKSLVASIRRLWESPDFAVEQDSSWEDRRVETEASPDAQMLPSSGHIVRGSPHVEVRERGGTSNYRQDTSVRNAIFETLSAARRWPKDGRGGHVAAAEEGVHRDYQELAVALVATPHIVLLLSDALGWKTYEHADLLAKFANDPMKLIDGEMLTLLEPLEESFLAGGISAWRERSESSKWERVATEFSTRLQELSTRVAHSYEAVAYLNAPLVDSYQPIDLGSLGPDSKGRIAIRSATDDDLTKALRQEHWGPLPLGLARTNTLLTFPLSIPIDASVDSYESAFPWAEQKVRLVVDVLRLVYQGDMGVAALRIFAVSPTTPDLRRTFAWSYEPGNAPLIPRRLAFSWPASSSLTESEISEIKRLIPLRMNADQPKGLDVAFRRFRDSCERFHPDDPQQLLDIAIAFEALLLGDISDKDLGYRLRLRGARWLEADLSSRTATFDLLNRLYSLRSKIAHGDDFASGKEEDRNNLAITLQAARALLRRALRMSLEGQGPGQRSKVETGNWWKKIELS